MSGRKPHARTETVARQRRPAAAGSIGTLRQFGLQPCLAQGSYRSQKRTEATIDDEVEATIAGREPSALSLLEVKDSGESARQILNQLPERDRRLLQSVLLEERNKDVVCTEFGITREYLRVLLHRARQSFKSCYTSRFGVRVKIEAGQTGATTIGGQGQCPHQSIGCTGRRASGTRGSRASAPPPT